MAVGPSDPTTFDLLHTYHGTSNLDPSNSFYVMPFIIQANVEE